MYSGIKRSILNSFTLPQVRWPWGLWAMSLINAISCPFRITMYLCSRTNGALLLNLIAIRLWQVKPIHRNGTNDCSNGLERVHAMMMTLMLFHLQNPFLSK